MRAKVIKLLSCGGTVVVYFALPRSVSLASLSYSEEVIGPCFCEIVDSIGE